MCAVSAIIAEGYRLFPDPQTFPKQFYPDYAELVRKARLYDELIGQKDCTEGDKGRWQAELERVMRERYGLEPNTK